MRSRRGRQRSGLRPVATTGARRAIRPAWIALALLLAACGPGEQEKRPAKTAAPAIASAGSQSGAAAEEASFEPDALVRYACQPGTRVALLRDDAASVLLPDGARYLLDRVADSDPPVYAGHSLFFTVTGQGGYLSQADGARELACTPDAQAPSR